MLYVPDPTNQSKYNCLYTQDEKDGNTKPPLSLIKIFALLFGHCPLGVLNACQEGLGTFLGILEFFILRNGKIRTRKKCPNGHGLLKVPSFATLRMAQGKFHFGHQPALLWVNMILMNFRLFFYFFEISWDWCGRQTAFRQQRNCRILLESFQRVKFAASEVEVKVVSVLENKQLWEPD